MFPENHEEIAAMDDGKGGSWSDGELHAAVEAYNEMLELQRRGETFNKAAFNEELRANQLKGRTKSSVEFRMQNISAVLEKQGQQWLRGYRPAHNVGIHIRERISRFLASTEGAKGRRRREYLLDGISADHVLKGIALFDAGASHGFRDSTKFDLVHEGKFYPPKAIMGLAAVSGLGIQLGPEDFTGGLGSKCFRIFEREGFKIAPKASEFAPTADPGELDERTREALRAPTLPRPKGEPHPRSISAEVRIYVRDPLVRAYVLRRAGGRCECCNQCAPFTDEAGVPFLEVHHIVSLAEGGADLVENTVAICPNCHRECHYGRHAKDIMKRLLEVSKALQPESPEGNG